MRIGLLGGSFNPAHSGHIYISNLAVKKFDLDQIWWIPTKHNPLKDRNIYEDFAVRFKKCLEISKNNSKIRIKHFRDNIYTYDLINSIKTRYKNDSFLWIMGADNLENFHKWENFRKIIATTKIAIFNRNNHLLVLRQSKTYQIYRNLLKINNNSNKNRPNIIIVRNKNQDISSTKIRNLHLSYGK